jgi:hypothetical protein
MDEKLVMAKFEVLKSCSPELLDDMIRLLDFLDFMVRKCKDLEAEIAYLKRSNNA